MGSSLAFSAKFSRLENLHGLLLPHQIRKPTLVAGGPHNVVVYPMVVAAPRLAHEQSVVIEAMTIQPRLCDFAMLFRTRCKKGDSSLPAEVVVKRCVLGHPAQVQVGGCGCPFPSPEILLCFLVFSEAREFTGQRDGVLMFGIRIRSSGLQPPNLRCQSFIDVLQPRLRPCLRRNSTQDARHDMPIGKSILGHVLGAKPLTGLDS
jgi:hypothetical protein